MVEKLIDSLHPDHEFIAQVGNTKYKSEKIKILEYIPEIDFKKYISNADVVISHAGSGAIFNAIQKGKKTIAVARLHKYNEMVNDHQTEIVKKLASEGYILDGTASLIEAWNKLDEFVPRKSDFTCSIPRQIENILTDWGINTINNSKNEKST